MDQNNQNVIFQSPTNPQQPSPLQQPPATQPLPGSIPSQPLPSQQPTLPQQPSAPVPPPLIPQQPPSSGILSAFPIAKLILGVIGVIVFITILVFVLGNLFKGKGEKVTLNYWGLWEDKAVMQPIIDEFQRANPNITINYTKEDPQQYTDRLLARAANGLGPDIFRYHNTWVPMLLPILLPLPTDVINKNDFNKTYYPAVSGDLVKGGGIYGIPLDMDTLALFVNPALLQAAGVKAPTTWEQFASISAVLTVKDQNQKIKTAGAAIGTYDNIVHAPDIVGLLLAQNGADNANLNKTSQFASDALNFYTSFATDPQTSIWDTTQDPSINSFAAGKVAMIFGYSWDIFTIKQLSPAFDFRIYPVPHLPNRNITIASYWVEGVSNKSKHPKEALAFMKFLSQKDTAQKLYSEEAKTRLFGEAYPRVDLADSLKDNQYLSPFLQQAPTAVSSFFNGETGGSGIDAQMNGYLGNAIRSILNGSSPDSAVSGLNDGVTQVLQQYGQH